MISSREPDQVTERELAALADGSLPRERRARVERAVAASSELQADLRDQRSALSAVRTASAELAPAALRVRVAPARRARRPRRRVGALALASVAALAVAVVVTLGGGPAESPTVADAAVLATRPPAAAVHRAAHAAATLPRPSGAGLRFPDWQDGFGWKAVGFREDRVGGRPATTVFYRRRGALAAYTIVSGRPLLPAGSPARSSLRNGTVLHSLTLNGRPVVTWLRRGHTCVLSGTGTSDVELLRLAAWRGAGGIQY